MNEAFGKDFYRKGNSVKRSGPFSEPPDSENRKVAVQIHFPKISSFPKTQIFPCNHFDGQRTEQVRTGQVNPDRPLVGGPFRGHLCGRFRGGSLKG